MGIDGQIGATTPGFPVADLEATIREALRTAGESQAILRPRIRSAAVPEIDSLVVVEVICAIEELLGVKLAPTFVPRGGYDGVESCVNSLKAEARRVWVETTREKEKHHA